MEIGYSTDYFSDTYGLKNSIDIIFKMCSSIEICINTIDNIKELDVIENKINKNSIFCVFKISDDILDKFDHRGLIYILRKNISPWNIISVNSSKIYNYRKLWIDSFKTQLFVINDSDDIMKFVDIIGDFNNPIVRIGINLDDNLNKLDISHVSHGDILYRTTSIQNLNPDIIESNSQIIICKKYESKINRKEIK